MWIWFLPASRTFLNHSGPREKSQNPLFFNPTIHVTNQEKSLVVPINPFKWPYYGGLPSEISLFPPTPKKLPKVTQKCAQRLPNGFPAKLHKAPKSVPKAFEKTLGKALETCLGAIRTINKH